MRYTEQIEDSIFGRDFNEDDDENYDNVINFLNAEFRTFGDGLTAITVQKIGKPVQDPVKTIKSLCKNATMDYKIIGNDGTLHNWFKESKRPKKSEESRRRIFAFAFALKLTPSETADLFHKVYLDRAINQRNYKEVIYYYCLKNDLSFSQAEKIISSVSLEKNNNDKTLYTSVLSDELSTLDSTSDLISYINNHSHNFSINPKSAVDILLNQKGKAFELLNNDRKILYEPKNYIGADKTSDNFLYSVITDRSVTGKKGTKPISFKNAALPEEIKKSFPKPEDFSGKNSSMEEIRKAIILLFSYNYWNKANEYSLSDFYDEYIDELNLLLYKAGMSPLYYGNPYDWLFLYCTYRNDNIYHSLDIFRGILSTALDEI